MQGSLHLVEPQAYNDSLVNTYTVNHGSVSTEVATTQLLRERVREIYAIENLRDMSKTKAFTESLKQGGKQKVKSAVGIITNPLGTVRSVPKGASRFFGGIGESLKGGSSELEDKGLKGLTGVSKAKAKLAFTLGVDPYSTNQELQEQLTKVARAQAGGGFALDIATMPIGGPAGSVLTVLDVNTNIQQTIAESSPDDLRIRNRKKLFALGVNREDADEFLMHPWFSPLHETVITEALSDIGVAPNAFLRKACEARTAEDAIYFHRLSQVLAAYKARKAPLRSIQVENGIVCAMDGEGSLVVPISCDYAIWAEKPAGRVDAFVALRQSRPEIKGLALWVDGKVSDRALEELKRRKIEVVTGVLDKPSKSSTQ